MNKFFQLFDLVTTFLNRVLSSMLILKTSGMKISKTLLQTILVAVTAATVVSCSKSVDEALKKDLEKTSKTDSTHIDPFNCPACGMG